MAAPRRSLFTNFALARSPIFAYNERMTTIAPAITPVVPLPLRILGAYGAGPAVRPVLAEQLLGELLGLGAPTAETLRSWSLIAGLLNHCAMSLPLGDERYGRLARFAQLALDLLEAAREQMAAVPVRAKRARRVIDVECTAVAS